MADDHRENRHDAALLLIDVINDFAFDAADSLIEQMAPAASAISELRDRARALSIPVVYVNDNFGLWRSEKSEIVGHCREKAGERWRTVEALLPGAEDYFIVKPRHSGFFASNLPVLLPDLRARRLILTGVAADICVLFTANDAYMRDYRLWVPSNCVASIDADRTRRALDYMEKILKADVSPFSPDALGAWLKNARIPQRFGD